MRLKVDSCKSNIKQIDEKMGLRFVGFISMNSKIKIVPWVLEEAGNGHFVNKTLLNLN